MKPLPELIEEHLQACEKYGSAADLEAFGAALFQRREELRALIRKDTFETDASVFWNEVNNF